MYLYLFIYLSIIYLSQTATFTCMLGHMFLYKNMAKKGKIVEMIENSGRNILKYTNRLKK